jgi:hypothetical protein
MQRPELALYMKGNPAGLRQQGAELQLLHNRVYHGIGVGWNRGHALFDLGGRTRKVAKKRRELFGYPFVKDRALE